MKRTMNKNLLLLNISLLGACSLVAPVPKHESAPVNDTAPEVVAIHVPAPVIALLAKRQAWCLLPEDERLQVQGILQTRNNSTSQFQQLILATCAPEHNAKQSRALITTLSAQSLSEAERALLSLIDDTNRALLQTQQERDVLQAKLRHTIDGISDIEAEINSNETQQLRGQQ